MNLRRSQLGGEQRRILEVEIINLSTGTYCNNQAQAWRRVLQYRFTNIGFSIARSALQHSGDKKGLHRKRLPQMCLRVSQRTINRASAWSHSIVNPHSMMASPVETSPDRIPRPQRVLNPGRISVP